MKRCCPSSACPVPGTAAEASGTHDDESRRGIAIGPMRIFLAMPATVSADAAGIAGHAGIETPAGCGTGCAFAQHGAGATHAAADAAISACLAGIRTGSEA